MAFWSAERGTGRKPTESGTRAMQGAWRAARPADVTFAPVVAGLVDLAGRRPLLVGNPAVVVGLVHGGVFASMAESMCSAATWLGVKDDGMAAMGQANSATFLRPITQGHVHATARCRHRGRTTWVWDVEITDDEGRLCALVRMTVAVRPLRPQP